MPDVDMNIKQIILAMKSINLARQRNVKVLFSNSLHMRIELKMFRILK